MTTFVRFAGCNMRCPGWPCDTPHAIDPAIWRFESERLDAFTLAQRVMAVSEDVGSYNICYTGGEPFMQPDGELHELTRILAGHAYQCEVFTNGSYRFRDWARYGLTIMMDWKLAGSGEAQSHRAERQWNAGLLKPGDGVKFVVKDVDDLDEARRVEAVLKTNAQIWVGAAWGHIRDVDIVDYIKYHKLPWRLNVQTHKHIWEPTARGV